jgi:adenylate kinase family enzyme
LQEKFFEHPDKYLAVPKVLPGFTLSIAGWPSSGKSTLARAFSKRYNLPLLSIDDQFQKWADMELNNEEFPEREKSLAQKVV